MQYFEYCFDADIIQQQALIGLLSAFPFEAFQEEEKQLKAYIPETEISEELEKKIKVVAKRLKVSLSRQKMPDVNWNAEWEASFKPVLVGEFCGIRASFHEPFPTRIKYQLIIDPEMAFGTGHHATTTLMIKALENFPVKGLKVFDYGCGSGILGILCAQMGAATIDGIDYDIHSVENSLKNAQLNGVKWNLLQEATLKHFEGSSYDLILANINRNVLLESLDTLFKKARPGAGILLSGFYEKEVQIMSEQVESSGFRISSLDTQDSWVCMKIFKPDSE